MADLWDWLTGGSESKQSQTEEGVKREQTAEGTASSSQTGQTGAEKSTTQTSQVTLAPEVQQQLIAAIGRLGGGTGSAISSQTSGAGADALAFARDIVARAGGASPVIEANIASAQAAERLNFERDTMGDILRTADQLGSRDNSTTQLLRQRGLEDLAVRQQQIATQGRLQGRELVTNEMNDAFSAILEATKVGGTLDIEGAQSNTAQMAGLADVLKGANVMQSSTTDARTEQQQTQNSLTQSLRDILATASTKTKGTAEQGSSLFDLLGMLMSN